MPIIDPFESNKIVDPFETDQPKPTDQSPIKEASVFDTLSSASSEYSSKIIDALAKPREERRIPLDDEMPEPFYGARNLKGTPFIDITKGPKPERQLSLVQGGPLGEKKRREDTSKLALDVLKNKYKDVEKSYMINNLRMHQINPNSASPDLATAARAGWTQSLTGRRGVALGYRQEFDLTPEQYESMSPGTRFIYSLAQYGGSIPGYLFGAGVGAGFGGPIGAMAGAFGFEQGLREYYDQLIEKGEVKGPRDFFDRVKSVAVEELKGMATGKVMEVAGTAAGKTGVLGARTLAEAASLVAVPSALEQRLPIAQDYYDTAAFLLGLKLMTHGPKAIGKMRRIFRETGRTPQELKEDVKADPELMDTLTKEEEGIPQEVLDRAKAKVEATEKVQADLAAKAELAKNPPSAEEIVKEELKVKGEKVKKAKAKKTKTDIEPEVKPELDEGTKIAEEAAAAEKETAEPSMTDLIEKPKVKEGKVTKKKAVAEPAKTKVVKKKEAKKKVPKPEPITEVDEQTGTPSPPELKADVHPFRDADPEHTNTMSKLFLERIRNKDVDPEVFTRYMINEVNRWLNGEEPATPIEKLRDGLSNAAAKAENVASRFETRKAFESWKATVSEAARWARESDRKIVKRTGGTQLNMMIPVDQIPDMVKDILKTIKIGMTYVKGIDNVPVNNLYRNKGIFDKTGFWLGKDGKWRYEIDDNDTRYNLPKTDRELYDATGFVSSPLTSVVNNPKLYEAIPELKDVFIRHSKDLDTAGVYHPDTKTIDIKRLGDKDSVLHEIQHAVNDIMKSRFRGSNVQEQEMLGRIQLFKQLRDTVKDPEIKKELTDLIYEAPKSNKSVHELTYDLRDKAIRKSQDDFITIEQALHDYGKTTAFENYMKDPGEMESRLASERMEMSAEQRKAEPPWETLERLLDKEGRVPVVEDWDYGHREPVLRKIKDFSKSPGLKLYSGLDPTELYKTMKNLPKFLKDEIDKETKNIRMAIAGAHADKNKEFAGVSLDRLEKDLKLLKGAPKAYFGIMAGRMNHEANRTGSEAAAQVRDHYEEIYNKFEKSGIKLYTGIDPTEATKAIIAGAKRLSEYTKRARGMKVFKPAAAANRLKEEFTRSFVDRSGNIRRDLLDQLGDDGYEIIQKMYLSKGASSLAAQQLKQMRNEVYAGLSKDEKRILDNLILADRMLDIGKYKTAKQFKFPDGLTPTESAAYNELFQFTEGISAERAALLKQRAGAYFEWMKKPLKDMLDAELITQEEYDALSSHNYRRLKLVDIYDKRYQTKMGKKKRTVYDSGVEALAHGRDTDIFEPSSEVMALEVFNRAYGRILNNDANQTLLNLARTQKDNPFVATKEKPSDKIPTGWDRIFVYEKGERKAIYLSPEMAKEWITNNPEMSYKMSQLLRYASGSQLLRTFATGIDWGFALANLPRDVMHSWYATRVFENGKWKPIYSSNMPVFMWQMGKDISDIFHDAVMRKGRYEDYIREGGGMEFLVHQGRLLQRGRHIESPIDKVQDVLGYFGETSEIMTRLAIRDRVIKRRAAERGISYEEAYADKDIRREATFAARDYMDFGQGGGIGKAVDNAIPYLNAGIQGTRGLFRAFKDNPMESTWKLTQFASLVTGLYVANQSLNPKTMQSLQGNIDMQGNLCIPLGDGFAFQDEKGQTRYPYFKVPLDPGQKFFKMFFEASTDKMFGNPVDVDAVANSLTQLSPVGTSSLPPTVGSVLGYVSNRDFWLNEDIWRRTEKPLPWPQSKEEYVPGQTPQAMIDIGQMTGLSPERLKYALEELVTGGSQWSWLVGVGYDGLFSDLPKEKKEFHLADVLAKTPVIRRFIGVTNPYSQFSQPIDTARDESMVNRWVENRGLDQRIESYLYEGGERKDVIDYITSFKDKDTYNRLRERFIFQEKIKDLPNRSFWLALKGTPDTEARAKIYVERLNRASAEEADQIMKELSIVQRAGGVVSDDFRKEVMKLRGQ